MRRLAHWFMIATAPAACLFAARPGHPSLAADGKGEPQAAAVLGLDRKAYKQAIRVSVSCSNRVALAAELASRASEPRDHWSRPVSRHEHEAGRLLNQIADQMPPGLELRALVTSLIGIESMRHVSKMQTFTHDSAGGSRPPLEFFADWLTPEINGCFDTTVQHFSQEESLGLSDCWALSTTQASRIESAVHSASALIHARVGGEDVDLRMHVIIVPILDPPAMVWHWQPFAQEARSKESELRLNAVLVISSKSVRSSTCFSFVAHETAHVLLPSAMRHEMSSNAITRDISVTASTPQASIKLLRIGELLMHGAQHSVAKTVSAQHDLPIYDAYDDASADPVLVEALLLATERWNEWLEGACSSATLRNALASIAVHLTEELR